MVRGMVFHLVVADDFPTSKKNKQKNGIFSSPFSWEGKRQEKVKRNACMHGCCWLGVSQTKQRRLVINIHCSLEGRE